jgi:hypothetical protein
MSNNFNDLIKKSFLYYDNKNNEYKKFIKSNNVEWNSDKLEINFKKMKKKFKYEILGAFDNQSKIWLWGWMFPGIKKDKTILVKKLLNYGLDIDADETKNKGDESTMFYVRTQLINSRFLLDDQIQLDIHLALASYLIKDNFKFIYPENIYLDKNNKRFLTTYYLIK